VAQSDLSIENMERGAVEVAGVVKKPTSFAGGFFCFSTITSNYRPVAVSLIR
jgi:hypothetical protein